MNSLRKPSSAVKRNEQEKADAKEYGFPPPHLPAPREPGRGHPRSLRDCADADCAIFCSPRESSATHCADNEDNDADGLVDCADPSCAANCEQSQAECRETVDNDDNGLTNCEDPGSAWVCERASCTTAFCDVESCKLGGPPPGFGDFTDACAWQWGVESRSACEDAVDKDGDTLTGLSDPDCAANCPPT